MLKRKLSMAARNRIAAAQRERWAKARTTNTPTAIAGDLQNASQTIDQMMQRVEKAQAEFSAAVRALKAALEG